MDKHDIAEKLQSAIIALLRPEEPDYAAALRLVADAAEGIGRQMVERAKAIEG